ncbi:hypothetical protein K457DRAFT_128806 [Linnemannia elongata AG-77]|uniref:Uncharacterized protein n=1 Tax=Linnemannia elongata AG-77 TaxID=1314771 RepID=A0A197JMP7_9FUNG|nr:hypothetical protein K457DRAFT_128806 [Linnemannia elongata AG-77]
MSSNSASNASVVEGLTALTNSSSMVPRRFPWIGEGSLSIICRIACVTTAKRSSPPLDSVRHRQLSRSLCSFRHRLHHSFRVKLLVLSSLYVSEPLPFISTFSHASCSLIGTVRHFLPKWMLFGKVELVVAVFVLLARIHTQVPGDKEPECLG